MSAATPESPVEIGWMVITPEGSVVDAGPPAFVKMVAAVGEPAEEN